ncbi:MAG: hypothetical protein LJF04_04605 [Gemmatimonadetes bacterium]|nr:hypothetical protein [Gemmatimonadota bacterium]
MSTFLFTTLPSNDLGLLTRSLPIARELRDLGHEVLFCSPGAAPRRLVEDAGFEGRVPDEPLYSLSDEATMLRLLCRGRWHEIRVMMRLWRQMRRSATAEVWTVDHFFALLGTGDVDFARAAVASLIRLIRDCRADAVVDFWNPLACIAARATGTRLVSVLQADTHPDSAGFIWWRPVPAGLPTAVTGLNQVLAELELPSVQRTAELLLGDPTLVLGIPETDPVPGHPTLTHIGPILWEPPNAALPEWVPRSEQGQPLVWVYPGNMRYMRGSSTPFDSLVVLEACIEALSEEPVQVVLTTGHQPLPRRFRHLPANFRYAPYLPALSLAERCSLMIHHGGYGSCQTGLWAGRPQVIVPTYSERESNARRVAAAGAGIVVLPEGNASGTKKHLRPEPLRDAVRLILSQPEYARNAERLRGQLRRYGGARQAARLIAQATSTVST